MYLPTITDGHRVATYVMGPYIAIVLTDCESSGMIEYKHALFVYLPDPQAAEARPQVVMAVAAELSSFAAKTLPDGDEPAYFLGVFPGDGHLNMGLSSDWANLEKFTHKALTVAQERLKVTHAPRKVRDDDERND